MCIDPARSRVHSNFIFNAAYDWMVRWLNGDRPPSMPSPLALAVPKTMPDILARDEAGIAFGGIRLPDVEVPAATNTGWNTGGKPPTPDTTCQQAGTFRPFDDARLRSLYDNHADYVAKVSAAADVNVEQGFLLPEDAASLVAEADASDVLATSRSDGSVRVAEFFHPAARRYFWTADIGERTFLDFEGGAGGGWFRTGETFFAWPATSTTPSGTVAACRFMGTPGAGPRSHFYTVNASECAALKANPLWIYEGIAFRVPSACLSATTATRLWRPGATIPDSRHRFAVRHQVILNTIAAGYLLEGPVFCVLH
jgi:hypothetical protein